MTAQPQFTPDGWPGAPTAPARRIHGTAGGSLTDASWLGASAKGAARVGQAGEVRTAELLNAFAKDDDGVTVLHDLMTPSKKYKANIDHIVVSGSTVYPIDSKVWKPGTYWTLSGKTRRGFERFEPAEKKTMVVIAQALEGYFASLGVKATIAEPLLLVWPSSKRDKLKTGFLTVPGARVIPGPKVEKTMEGLFKPGGLLSRGKGRPADAAIVNALIPLLTQPTGTRPAAPSYGYRPPGGPLSGDPYVDFDFSDMG